MASGFAISDWRIFMIFRSIRKQKEIACKMRDGGLWREIAHNLLLRAFAVWAMDRLRAHSGYVRAATNENGWGPVKFGFSLQAQFRQWPMADDEHTQTSAHTCILFFGRCEFTFLHLIFLLLTIVWISSHIKSQTNLLLLMHDDLWKFLLNLISFLFKCIHIALLSK